MRIPLRRFSIPFNDLGVRLFCLALAVLVPAWIFACAFILESRQLALRQMRSDLLIITDLVRHTQIQLIDHTRALLMSISNEKLAKAPSSAAFAEKLSWALASDPFLCNLGFIDPQGAVLSSAIPVHGKLNLGDREYFKRVLEHQSFAVGLFQIGRITGKPTINFGYPVFDRGKHLQGVLFAALDLAWVEKFAQKMPLPRHSSIFILDSDGTIVSRYPDADKWMGRKVDNPAIFSKLSEVGSGIIKATGIDGQPRLYAFLPVKSLEPNPIFIGVGFSTEDLLAPYNRFLIVAVVAFVVCVLVSLLAARYLGSKWIVDPIRKTVNEAAKSESPLFAMATADLDHLSMAVGKLSHRAERSEIELEETRASLHHSEQLYQALVTRLPSVVWSADQAGKIVQISPSVQRMFGFDINEVINSTLLRDHIHPDDLETVSAAYAGLFEGHSFDLMYRMKHKNGRWIWVENHATRLDTQGEAMLACGVISNLSERTRLEQEMFERPSGLLSGPLSP